MTITGPTEGTHSCSGCSSRWFGANIAHCANCHRTFSAASTFDRHRKQGRCVSPALCDLIQNRTGVWVGARPDDGSGEPLEGADEASQ